MAVTRRQHLDVLRLHERRTIEETHHVGILQCRRMQTNAAIATPDAAPTVENRGRTFVLDKPLNKTVQRRIASDQGPLV